MIKAEELTREFSYYEKEPGLRGSMKNLFAREKKIKTAVDHVSFEIEDGEFVGFLGPNGAGKSTTIKMLSGILCPTSGSASVNGHIPWNRKDAFKRSIALVSGQKSQLWTDLPAMETFNVNRHIYEIPKSDFEKTVKELSELLQVEELLKVQVRRLSLGERMKMEIIASLLHQPPTFFLDEPTLGLDILSQNAIRAYLKAYNRQRGATILITSHYLQDIEALCSRTIVINHGGVIYDGTTEGINRTVGDKKIITVTFSDAVDAGMFDDYSQVTVEKNKVTLEVDSSQVNSVVQQLLSVRTVEDYTVGNIPIEKSIELLYRR